MRPRVLRAFALGTPVLLAIIALSGAIVERAMRQRAHVEYRAPGRLVPVQAGRRMQIDCRGQGSPTVVLESGLDNLGSLSWSAVHDSIARTTRVCAYSRAGIMWSDPSNAPFSSNSAARDLHAALAGAGETPPWVMVGHSIGAMYATRFAAEYPLEVAGLVFVDPTHPEQFEQFRMATGKSLLPAPAVVKVAAALAGTGLLRLLPEQNPVSWPSNIRAAATAFLPVSVGALSREMLAIPATLSDARSLRDFGRRPLVVLSAGDERSAETSAAMGLTQEQGRRLREVQHRLHRDLATLSSNGAYELVPNTSHHIQIDRPDAVIAAIRNVVTSIRARHANAQ